jgi:hypothetical protein
MYDSPCLEKVLYLGKPQDRTFRSQLPYGGTAYGGTASLPSSFSYLNSATPTILTLLFRQLDI